MLSGAFKRVSRTDVKVTLDGHGADGALSDAIHFSVLTFLDCYEI